MRYTHALIKLKAPVDHANKQFFILRGLCVTCTYESEAWAIGKVDEKRLSTSKMKFKRRLQVTN
jgi:hypothetical protein